MYNLVAALWLDSGIQARLQGASVERNLIYDFYRTEKERVTLKRMYKKVESQLGFKGVTSVRKLIRELDFHWWRTQDNKKVLMERHDVRALRELSKADS
jgi:hypothetical protein